MSTVTLPDWIEDDEVIRRSQFGHDKPPVQKLPPWTGDDRAMLQWLKERLLAMRYAERAALLMESFECTETEDGGIHIGWIKGRELANAIALAAECGDVGPLRKMHPDIAEFINLPKRRRGKRFNRSRYINPTLYAAQEAQRIRALWEKFYPEFYPSRERNRSADWFAAKLSRVEITEQQVRNRVKKL